MKYVRQFLIILLVSFMGEVLHAVLPLPVPASIYGLLLMLAGLKSGIIPIESVQETSAFLIEIMPMMFIPAAVGLLVTWTQLKEIVVPVVVITIVTTIFVMVITGRAAQWIIEREEKKDE